ncbi:MAG: hypothetical protein BSOLF_0518 [Candidatus Carbobacillus altaicus]|uniref:Uncharacterized protein n=1 Tax=Candidatus Carbonibacillus altaicus TaxID=2163959 RepID=A0A2R6XXE3_9BACL|nr:MAG: hypothetical protein BSOLF_0518 [Candidatus Carbobacillus altaicus]
MEYASDFLKEQGMGFLEAFGRLLGEQVRIAGIAVCRGEYGHLKDLEFPAYG